MSHTDPPMTPDDVAAPSRFWQTLGSEHERAAATFGKETVKRHQALRYFTFRWKWSLLPTNDQARFLFTHSRPAAWWHALAERMDLAATSWDGVPWPRRERMLYTTGMRLLWQYAQRHGHPAVVGLEEPALGAPLPVHLGGRLISQDLGSSALEVASIDTLFAGRPPRSILEVGAGYGRSAYALLHAYPGAHYTIVDIEPALSLSRWYLSELFPPERLTFVRPDDVGQLSDGSFDLAVSISSLQEMTNEQIVHYLRLFDRVAAGGHVYLKQWTKKRNRENDVDFRFETMPVGDAWEPEWRRRCPVQTDFTEGGWSVPSRDTSR